MKIDEICGAAYNFESVGKKSVMNISYNISSQSKLSFLFQGVHKRALQ